MTTIPRRPTDKEIDSRAEAVSLAIMSEPVASPERIVERAKIYADFMLTGNTSVQAPKKLISITTSAKKGK